MSDENIKQNVREFYDQVGWQEVGEGVYQNARYEDLRPVSREYIHNCHMRVKQHLPKKGCYLLDAGSGPIQYPEYVTYSEGYKYRVCADISIQALTEARKRVDDHGLMVVADIANLPFAPEVFDGVVSLHTIHHLPLSEHPLAYNELFRVMKPGQKAVVVNGWHKPPLGVALDRSRKFTLRVRGFINRRILRRKAQVSEGNLAQAAQDRRDTKSTFVEKNSAAWLKANIGNQMPLDIRVWRSVSVKVLRTFAHDRWGGRVLLRFLFWLEERFPHWFGENGQYPLVVVSKPKSS
jgi:ubiquinone/menaquinone biosynthesis C-methylase UbiE